MLKSVGGFVMTSCDLQGDMESWKYILKVYVMSEALLSLLLAKHR